MSENFKTIKGFEGRYWISDLGRVFDCEKKRFLKQSRSGSRSGVYFAVMLPIEGKQIKKYIHRLIAEAFIPNPLGKENIDHIDGDPINNSLDNLRWVTHSENQHNRKRAKGYSWHNRIRKWQAIITVNGKRKHLGYYVLASEARQAYLDAKKIYHPSSPIV